MYPQEGAHFVEGQSADSKGRSNIYSVSPVNYFHSICLIIGYYLNWPLGILWEMGALW